MNNSRRNALLSTLFGSGYVGLRALATGIPASLLLNPRSALASTCDQTAPKTPQFVIMATSENGDPINAGVPGTYGIAPNSMGQTVFHSEPNPGSTTLQIGGTAYGCNPSWAAGNMPNLQSFLGQTQFWHIMTDTPVHPKETQVLGLMSAITPAEMFPSFLAKNLAPCLGTIQQQPVSVGAANPTEALTFNGAALPVIPPSALKDTLYSDPTSLFNKNGLQGLRDSTLASLNDIYSQSGASPAQQAFINQYINSEADLRGISTTLLQQLADLSTSQQPQIDAALALIQMKVTPVISIHIPFGGDNHHDAAYTSELTETQTGCATIDYLLSKLGAAPFAGNVTFISLNVFGRTFIYDPVNGDGRQHNMNHQASIVIGKPFKGGVIGGIGPITKTLGGDFGALGIHAADGSGVANPGSGDIRPVDTLASWGRTVAQGVGVDPAVIDYNMSPTANPANQGTVQTLTSVLS